MLRAEARPGWGAHGRTADTRGEQQTDRRSRTFYPRRGGALAVYSGDGRRVGQWVTDPDGSVWLEKRGINPTDHRLRRPVPAYATDEQHLEEMADRGARGVRLRLTTGETLTASLALLQTRGFAVNRGAGPQWALAEVLW